ncbi:hypothetical protein [Mycoplasma sp. SG1]|uniref:hypothetical protein n=1 Tax=Mycoplasma sp. SG1 TaxID=2810348 RepID=UPI00202521A0|nr:hypothetical protein [Mycoplasma sp. SG1]URM52924.1 hypothetical protein JRW51_01085 [Mycoplasma sp. SG1]
MNIFKKFALFSTAIFVPIVGFSFLPGFYIDQASKFDKPTYQNGIVFSFDYTKQKNKLTITYSNEVFLQTILDTAVYQKSSAYNGVFPSDPRGFPQVQKAINTWADKLISKDEIKNAFFEIDATNTDFNTKETIATFSVTGDYARDSIKSSTPKTTTITREISANKNKFIIDIELNLSEPRLPVVPHDPPSQPKPGPQYEGSFNFIGKHEQTDYLDFAQKLIVNPNTPKGNSGGFGYNVAFSDQFESEFNPVIVNNGNASEPASIEIQNNVQAANKVWEIMVGLSFFVLIFIGFSPALVFILKRF